MNDLDRAIIATLAYYGSFAWPLTLMDIRERLIPVSRLGGRDAPVSVSDILGRLDVLTAIGTVVHRSGMYALSGVPEDLDVRRIEQEKIWAQKWRQMLRRAWWLQAVPYVRALCASGSLALGNMSEQSDWDVFVIARAGRLYTARTGLLAIAWLMGALRTKGMRSASDRFCFNHYVTTDGMAIRHRSIYMAHGLAALVPVIDRGQYLERLWQANRWMGDCLSAPDRAEFIRRSVRPSRALGAIRWTAELILDTPVGALVERILRTWQQRRIARTPATHERGGRVIADDRELEFHPRSFETVALARYHAAIEHYGMGAYRERDSGLTR